MSSAIVILLKAHKSPEERDNNANRVIDELVEKGFTENEYRSGTTWINVHIRGGINDLNDAVKRMFELHNITFYVVPDHIDEVSDAIEKKEYFKAFTLCVSLYESFGKNILIRHFKPKLSISSSRLEDLRMPAVILMLYTHGFITEGVYSDMISVNKVRIELIHQYVSSIMSDELLEKINDNIPKVRRSLEALKQIHDKS